MSEIRSRARHRGSEGLGHHESAEKAQGREVDGQEAAPHLVCNRVGAIRGIVVRNECKTKARASNGRVSFPPDLQADSARYWCESEAGLGVRSSMGAQQQQLLASSCPDPPPSMRDPGAALQRWRLASPEERQAMRVARWNAADDPLRSDWRTMKVAASPPSARQEQLLGDLAPDDLTQTTFEPDWARLVGRRPKRVGGASRYTPRSAGFVEGRTG